jgi:hypothetical protein
MKHKDFKIGTEFYTCTGQKWRCTDVGTRTILAIEIRPDLEPSWFIGPPYAVAEISFDEYDIGGAYRNQYEAIEESLNDAKDSAHPGFSSSAVKKMFSARATKSTQSYKNKALLRIDRVGDDGEILHPYGAEETNGLWSVLVYGIFDQTFCVVGESTFVKMPSAKPEDFERRRNQLSNQSNKP